MKKIEKLTEEQEKKIPVYLEEWVRRGLTTERKTLVDAERDFTAFQRLVLNRSNPAPVVLLDSPAECWRVVATETARNHPEVKTELAKIEKDVIAKLTKAEATKKRKLTKAKFDERVREKVEAQQNKLIESLVKDQKIVYPYFDCQFWAGWFSFYEFCRNELGIKFDNIEAYTALLNCQPYGMVWPLDTLCVVCQPPTIIKKNNLGLHCEDGPALSYNGANEIYALNGVTVPKELVMTPAEELSLDFFKKEKNADIKAEFVRKFGVERMLDFGKLVDSYKNYDEKTHDWWYRSEYELHDMKNLFGVDYQPYLKMLNQTTGIWHVEAVSPQCRTLKDAIKERFGGREMKIVAIA